MQRKSFAVKVIVVFVVLSNTFFSQDGSLDSGFDGDGKMTTSVDVGGDDRGMSVALQSDGKIIIAGYSKNSGGKYDFSLIRLNTDGSLDASFGNGGKVTASLSSDADKSYAVAIQSDGKIVVGGYAVRNTDYSDFAVARFNADGSLDASFDSDGMVTTAFCSNCVSEIYGIGIQSDGKIVAIGENYDDDNWDMDFALARYDTNGALDATFGNNGISLQKFGSYDDEAHAIEFLPGDKFYVVGVMYKNSTEKDNFALARFDTDGTYDASFNGNGKIDTDFGNGNYDSADDIAIQSDGKIVLVGYSYDGSDKDFAVARYNSDGSLDASFDSDGKVTTDIYGTGHEDVAKSVVIQPDGKIVVAGWHYTGSEYDLAVVRYNSDGSLDTGFDTDGIVTTDVSLHDQAYALALQSDGKIVVAGYAKNSSGNYYYAAARYNNPSTTTPVELVSFAATTNGNEITLNWQTATEVNNYGFQVERQKSKGESSWEEIGFVEGAGNSNSPKEYSFTDNITESGTYLYRLKQIDIDGSYEYSNVVEVNVGTPAKFELMQNYPNPFNPTTTIKYSIPKIAGVETLHVTSLRIYNVLGEEIATLVNEKQSPGNYSVQFDASNLPSGVYFYTLQVGNFEQTRKMILLK